MHVIPNFVDTDAILPLDRLTAYRARARHRRRARRDVRRQRRFSQSLEMLVEAARAMPDVMFVINGDGAARPTLEEQARGLPTSASPATSRERLPRCSRPATSTSCRCAPGSARQRAVEDVLDPRRRPAGPRRDRRRHRGAADPRRVGRRRSRAAGRPGGVRRRAARNARRRPGRQAMGAAGRRWVEEAASPRGRRRGVRRPDPRADTDALNQASMTPRSGRR